MKRGLTFLIAIVITATGFAAQNIDSSLFYFQKGLEEKKAKRYLVASDNFSKLQKIFQSFKSCFIAAEEFSRLQKIF